MTWQIQHNNKLHSFCELNLTNLTRVRLNQGTDKVFFSQIGVTIDSPPLFPAHSPVSIFYQGKPWFHGIVTSLPGYATSSSETQHYEIAGPWWHLQNLVFQQNWNQCTNPNDTTLTSLPSGRVILGQKLDGSRLTSSQQLIEILQYAIDQGAPLQIGSVDINITFPFDETKDISCADAIKRVLRWTPDAIVTFDYSTPTPTINIQRKNQLQTTNINMKSNILSLHITPRPDLKSPAVILKYEKQHAADGSTWNTLHHDIFPQNATGKEFGSLVMTIDLHGSRSQTLKQALTTEPILENNPSWWKAHIPALASIPSNQISVSNISRQTELPNELTSGSIAPWMNKKVSEDTIRAQLSYSTESETIINQEVAIKILATDAQSQTYQHVITSDPGDSIPEGLAQALYESVSHDVFEGKITLQSKEVSESPINKKLNILGGHPEWAAMNCIIQRIRENIEKGTLTLEFGPAKHLGVNDRIEFLRANKKRRLSRNTSLRIHGSNTNQTLEMSTHSRLENTSIGSSQRSKLVIADPKSPNRAIVLDPASMLKDNPIQLTEEFVCENGVIKKRMVLASSPYEENNSTS